MKKFLLISILTLTAMLPGIAAVHAADLEVGVAWVGKSGMSNRVLQGLQKGFSELGVDAKLDLHKELGSMDEFGKAYQ
jgi:hypothetical protein